MSGACVCVSVCANALPQQPALQHDTDARKHSDVLNGGNPEVLDHEQRASKVDYYTGTLQRCFSQPEGIINLPVSTERTRTKTLMG